MVVVMNPAREAIGFDLRIPGGREGGWVGGETYTHYIHLHVGRVNPLYTDGHYSGHWPS